MVNWATNRERAIPDELWSLLEGHKWHATSIAGLMGILDSGSIELRQGHDSFCKVTLKAISLFDFGPTSVDIKSLGHWSEWCGYQQASRARARGDPQKQVGIWLRIDAAYVSENLLDAGTVRQMWKAHPDGKILPGVEAAHVGPLNIDKIDQVIVVSCKNLAEWRIWLGIPTSQSLAEVSAFIESLPTEPLSICELALLKARSTAARRHIGDPRR